AEEEFTKLKKFVSALFIEYDQAGKANFIEEEEDETSDITSEVPEELDHYLKERVFNLNMKLDILAWWKINGLNTSGRLITPHRNRLKPNTLEALMCSQSWLVNEIQERKGKQTLFRGADMLIFKVCLMIRLGTPVISEGCHANTFSAKVKSGLGYDSQFNEKEVLVVKEEEVTKTVFDNRSSDEENSLANDSVFRPEHIHPNIDFVKTGETVKHVKPVKSIKLVKPVQTAEQTKKSKNFSSNPKIDSKDWNGKMTQKLGLGFKFTKKACFVYGSMSHLVIDCTFHEDRMAKKSMLPNNVVKGTGHKESRPAWNNVQRINRQNKFSPTAVFIRFGRIPVSAAKPKVATSTSVAKPVNTAGPKQSVHFSKSRSTFHKSHSPIRRSFYNATTHSKMNSTKRVNTAGSKAISAVKGNGVIAVKTSAGCVWRPRVNDIDQIFKDNRWICTRVEYVDPQGGGNSLVRAATTASLDSSQDSSNITKTQSKATLNEPTPQGEGSGSGLGYQETIGGAMAQIRSEDALIQSIDPPLSTGYTVESGEDKMEHDIESTDSSIDPPLSTGYTVESGEDKMEDIESTDSVPQTPYNSPLSEGHIPRSNDGSMTLKKLTDLCTTLLKKVLDIENVKTPQAKKTASLKKRITKMEQRRCSRFLGFYPFRAGSSKRHGLGRRKVSKQGRKKMKPQQMFQDINDVLDKNADIEMIVGDKGNGEKGGSTAKTVSTARLDISAARPEVSTTEPKTPPTTTNLFDNEDVTIADTLVKMKNLKAKGKGIAFEDANNSARPIRSITTLQPLPTINQKIKIQAHLNEEAMIERERKKEAYKATLAEMYDEVQAHIDTDHELAVRLTLEEQKKYTVKERSKLLAELFKRKKKRLVKEIAEAIRSKPPITTQLRNLMTTYLKHTSRKKRAAGLSSKHKSPKKHMMNDQDYEDSDKEHRKCLKVVPDDDKAIDYETLDVKSLIIDCESQVLGTNKVGDVHVYELTRLDGSYRHFLTFSRMLKVLDRQDVLDLHKIIMERFLANDPEGYDLILWEDLKTLVESSEDDEIWRNQQDWKLLSWKLYETCGIHTLILDDSLVSINMFVAKRYLLTKEILEKMLSSILEAETESTLALDLIKLITLKIEEK
nr:hypothetical protein [Tanacetum cinerariifolium]